MLTSEISYWALLPCAALLCFSSIVFAWRPKGRGGGKHRKKREKAKKIFDILNNGDYAPGQKLSYLRKIDPYAFEELVLDAFERKGYEVIRNKRYSGDGGIDGRVRKDEKEYLIQCKRYRKHINPEHVEAFISLCNEAGVGGFFVHTGRTGKKSKKTVKVTGVRFLGGMKLIDFIFSEK